MMMRILFIMTLLIVMATAASAGEAVPDDYAFGMYIQTSGNGALYEFPFQEDVYKKLNRGDLQDICVFNGQGEMVPFSIRRAAGELISEGETINIPFFPLYEEAGKAADNIFLQVKRDSSGAIVTLNTSSIPQQGQKISAYLIDASAIKRPLSSLELDWQGAENGIHGMDIEYSDDLEHWYHLGQRVNIANLQYGGHTLVQRTISLGSMNAKYLRLSSSDAGEMVMLEKITAKTKSGQVEIGRRWFGTGGVRQKEAQDEYLFDTAGRFPVDRIRVRFPQRNTIVKAAFFSRGAVTEPWRQRQSSLIYDLNIDSGVLTSPEIQLTAVTDRYWMMRVERNGGGIGQGTPTIEFGWLPHTLLFSGRGNPPFTFAYGSALAMTCSGKVDDLLGGISGRRQVQSTIKPAITGQQFILGGEAALRPVVPQYNWKNLVLWSVLLVGVMSMAWMAVSLHRQMGSEDGES